MRWKNRKGENLTALTAGLRGPGLSPNPRTRGGECCRRTNLISHHQPQLSSSTSSMPTKPLASSGLTDALYSSGRGRAASPHTLSTPPHTVRIGDSCFLNSTPGCARR